MTRGTYTRHLVRGKTVREWAKHLGASVAAIYLWIRNGTLESRIDGNQVERKPRPTAKYHGKTAPQWAQELGCSASYVRQLAKSGRLKRIIDGKEPVYINNRRYVQGKTLAHWARQLGITRERARQLDEKGNLVPRINGEPPRTAPPKRRNAMADQNYRVEDHACCKNCSHQVSGNGSVGTCGAGDFYLSTLYGVCDKHQRKDGANEH
jgi:transposase